MVSAKSPDWLPSGWSVKVKVNKGRKQKCYVDPTSSCEFYTKPQVFQYLETVTSAAAEQKKIDYQNIDNIGSSSGGKSRSKSDVSQNLKTVRNKSYISKQREVGIDKLSIKNVVFEKGSPDELPPEWIKGIRTKKTSNGTKKYTEYTDPLSGYIFSSKKDALRYLETGDIDKCTIKPKKRETNDPNLMKDNISVAVQSEEIPEWLPHGWTMCYIDPTSGRKFHSKLEVTQYLETVNNDTDGVKNIEHNTERSTRSKSSLKPDSNPNEFESGISKKKKVGLGKNSVKNVVNERGSKGDLPPGGTKEIKTRKSVNVIEKEPLNIGRSTRSKSSLQPDTPQNDSPINNVLIERGVPDELPSANVKETKTRKSVDGTKKDQTPSAVDVKKLRYHTRRQLFTGSSEGKQDISASPAAKESSAPKTRGSKRKRDVEISVENGPVSTPSTAMMEEEKLPEKGTVKRGNRKNEIDLSKSKNRRGVSLHGRSSKTSAEVKLNNTNGKKTSAPAPQTQPSKRKRGVDVAVENASVSTSAAAILQDKKLPESGTVKRGSRKTQIDLSKSKNKRRISLPDLSKSSNKRGVSLRGRSSKSQAEVKPKNANGKDSSDPKIKPSKRKRGVDVSVENGSVSTPASAILQEEKLSENGTVKRGSRKTQIDSSKSKNNRVGSSGRSSKTPVEVKKPKNANGKESFDPTTKGSKGKRGMETSAKTRSAKTLQGEKLPKDEAVERSKRKTTESSKSKGQRALSLDVRPSKRLARYKPEMTTDFGSSEGAPWAATRKERSNIEANRCLDLALDAVADGEPKQLEAEPEREIAPRASVSKKITSAIEVSNQAEKPLRDQVLEEPKIEEVKQNEKPLEEDQTVQEDQPEIEEAKQKEKPLEEDQTVQEEQSERQESKNIEEPLKNQIISEGKPGKQEAKQSLKPLEEDQIVQGDQPEMQEAKQSLKPLEEDQTVQEDQPEMQKEKQSEKSLEEDQAIRDQSESIADQSPKFLEEDLAVQEDLPVGQEAKQSEKPLDDQAVLEEPPESKEANQSEKPIEEDQIIGEEQPEMGESKESKRPLEEDQGVTEYQPKWQEAKQTEKSLEEDQTIGEVQPEMEEAKQSGKTLEEDQAVQEDSPERQEANQSKKLLEEDQIVEEDQPELQGGKQIEKLLEGDKTSEEDQPENQKAKQTENTLEEDRTAPEEQSEWPEAKRIEEPLDDQTTPEEKPDGQEAKQIEKPLEDQLGRQEPNRPDKPLLDRAATEEPEIPATEQIEKPPVEDQAASEIQEGEKAEPQDSELFPFMESWADPCLDFAFKTLTGAVRAEEDSEAIQIPLLTQVDPFQNEVSTQYDAQEKPMPLQQWPASDVPSHFDAAPEKSVLLQQWPDNPVTHLPSGDISLPSCSTVDSDAGEKEYQPKVN